MINFKTKDAVLVCYAEQSGGKFLINCLGLSSQVLLQDADLAVQQLSGNLTQHDKFELLLQRIQQTKEQNYWNDLGLGDRRLSSPSLLAQISNTNYKFCFTACFVNELVMLKRVWPQSQVINFVNELDFIQYARPFALGDLPNNQLLDKTIRHKFQKSTYTPAMIDSFKSIVDQSLTWDCRWYLNKQQTVDNVKILYDTLMLNDFNETLIGDFYQSWIDCIKTLSFVSK